MSTIEPSMANQSNDSATPSEQQACISQLGDLNNNLHPIFHRHNFPIKFEYAAIEPSLRLASRFLTTNKLLHFWHAAFFGMAKEIHSAPSTDQQQSSFELHISRKPRLTAAQIKRTKRALTKLATKMRFRPTSSRKTVRFDIQGKLSGIAISEPHIAKLKELATADRDGYIWAVFELVVAILHALAHAVMHKFRRQGTLYYLRGSKTAEIGYEWEKAIFDGVISRFQSDSSSGVRDDIVLIRWPGSMLVNLQHVHGNGIGLRARRPPFDVKGELLGKVPFEHIESIFSEAFWTKVGREGVEAL